MDYWVFLGNSVLGPQWYMLCVSYGVCCLLVGAPVVQVVCLPVVVHDRGSDYAESRSYSSGRSGECWVSGASGLPTAPAILHVPRLSGVVNWGVTLVLCAVTDQCPRILLDSSAPQAVFRSWCRLVTRGFLASCTPSTICRCRVFG